MADDFEITSNSRLMVQKTVIFLLCKKEQVTGRGENVRYGEDFRRTCNSIPSPDQEPLQICRLNSSVLKALT